MLLVLLICIHVAPPVGPILIASDGLFRFQAIRTTAVCDLDGSVRSTMLLLRISWLSGTRPLFIDSAVSGVRVRDFNGLFIPVAGESGTLSPVEGRSSVFIEVALPGFPRAHPRIGLLEGKLNAVVASQMLLFKFQADLALMATSLPDGALRQRRQADVVCRVDRLALLRDRWTVRIVLDYPPGNRDLESYQAGAMVAFNELRLVGQGGKRLTPSAYTANVTSSSKVVVTYHFTQEGAAPKGKPSAWRIEYAAPARILDVPLRFSFRNVPLP